jgi:threonine dehydrogenase-like Zn-dependent dehydrogenase
MLRVEISRDSGVVATRTAPLGTPVYPGHEAMGRVVETGPDVRRVEVGQRVALIPGVFCSALESTEPCAFCRRGLYALCRRRQEKPAGFVGGGWSEGFVRHESQLFPIPDEIPDEAGCLFEPVSCSVHAVLRRPPEPGSRVLVVGAGMIGLTLVAALRALQRPLEITALARHDFQVEHARTLGASRAIGLGGDDPYDALAVALGTSVVGRRPKNRYLADGFDVVYDAVGSARSLHDAIRWCRPRGVVVLVGVNLFPGVLDRTPLWRREIELVGAVGHGEDEWEGTRCTTFSRVSDWLRAGRIDLQGLVTHRFPKERYREAIAAAGGKAASRAIRVVFDFR